MNKATLNIYSPAQQGTGAFDGGKITEIKPIDFPGGNSVQQRIGPLLYWAWASANGDGVIGLHPHKGFEIMSYVIEGEIGHSDTLGTKMRVGAGGAQVMQTGSGVQHQEEMFGERTDFFQIWFEPDLRTALHREPTYNQFTHEDFPIAEHDGVRLKTIIGEGAPVSIVTEVKMVDVAIQPGKAYAHDLKAGYSLAAVAISGNGVWQIDGENVNRAITKRDFSVIEASEDMRVSASATGEDVLRLAIIEVPQEVEYPLFA